MQPSKEPCPDLMRQHLEHLFDGNLDGCHDGLIEIAHTDTADGKLKHARLFGTDEIDAAIEFAQSQNRVSGQNIYVGAALRKATTPRDRRASDADILALPAFYTDLDDNDAAHKAKERYNGCPPTCVVITGKIPHTRAQLWWRLEDPERDLERARSQNTALAMAFGGDTSVVNASRVMRLAGSIAWPQKEGRVQENTELKLFSERKPYFEGQITKAFPYAVAPQPAPQSLQSSWGLNIGSTDARSVEAAMETIRAGHNWHNNLLRLIANWISRGWSDAEILAAGDSFTLKGYTAAQTRREVNQMILGARAKWAIPNPDNKIDEFSETPLCPQFVGDLNISMLPRRKWVLGRVLLRGYLTLLVSPPGVGKTTLVLAFAIAICIGKDLTGHDVYEPGRVWLHNNEDDTDELKRRLAAVLQHFDIPLEDIKDRLVMSSGADRPLVVARTDRHGNVVRQPDVAACIEFIKKNDIKVFIVDPFVETHGVEENSNEQIKEVAMLYREIARQGNCSVLLVHHTSKPQQASSDGYAGNMNTARGASSLLGVARVVQTLYAMSPRDSEQFGIPEEERYRYVRLDDAKANLSLISATMKWFERMGITIANGDEVGILNPISLKAVTSKNKDQSFLRSVMAALLRHNTDKVLTLNAAARSVAWSSEEVFHKYRETDSRGYQKATRPLRDAVMDACRAKITVTTPQGVEGFTVDTTRTPISLKRICNAVDPLSQPEFTEDEDETKY